MSTQSLRKEQEDVIRQLKGYGKAPAVVAALIRCRRTTCRSRNCWAVCRYGESRFYRANRNRILHLLKKAPRPVLEVHVTKASWARKSRQLHRISLRAAEQLARRALDKLYDADIVAVGTIKQL